MAIDHPTFAGDFFFSVLGFMTAYPSFDIQRLITADSSFNDRFPKPGASLFCRMNNFYCEPWPICPMNGKY
jgi:hypothetical protein